jgi:hypothetical protein
MELEIIEEIEACYAQTILSMYTIYLENELEKDILHEYSYKYITGKITLCKNDFIFSINLPCILDANNEKELSKRINILNKEYINGFCIFLEYSGGYWYEPIETISMKSVLGIKEPFKLLDDKQTIRFVLQCRKMNKVFPQKWLNRYFYEYKKFLPVLYKIKEKEYNDHKEKLKVLYQTLRQQIHLDIPTERFLWLHSQLQTLELQITKPFHEYHSLQSVFGYTANDNETLYLLRFFGYKII